MYATDNKTPAAPKTNEALLELAALAGAEGLGVPAAAPEVAVGAAVVTGTVVPFTGGTTAPEVVVGTGTGPVMVGRAVWPG